jgi:2'-5' RNA ligase
MSHTTDYYDVVILPPPALSRYAISASHRLAARFGSPLVLDERQAAPHISLYHVAVPRRHAPAFKDALSRLAGRTAPGALEVTGVHLYREFGSLAIAISKPAWLRRLYLRILHGTEALRDRDFDNERAWDAARLSAGQRRYLARYGTPLVGQHFIPHITVTALKDPAQLEAAAAMIRPPQASFRVTSLHVCSQGEYHTCRRVLYALGLENNNPAAQHRER